ncbi:SDR family oxidoreductase [Hyphomicrobiales bacterium 4NK60-0047b]
MDFTNKIILVTGANRGIGKALVFSLLEKGVSKIYAAARNTASLPDFQDARVVPLTLDITKAEQISAATRLAPDVDILINNAGSLELVSAFSGPLDKVTKEMSVNYFGLLHMMRGFLPVLENRPNSALVNIVSIAAFVNVPLHGGYCAAKAAAFSLTQGARIEWASKGIAVHSVNPGPIDTDMTKEIAMDKASPFDTAVKILDDLESDIADIFPDPTGQHMFETWQKDYKDLEAMSADMMKGA